MQKGIEKGTIESRLEIARKILHKGKDLGEIMEITGLMEEEIIKTAYKLTTNLFIYSLLG